MFDLISRENAIFQVLQELTRQNLHFVLVGGYAVSAYKHRFSVDADLVIKKEDLPQFEIVLQHHKFHRVIVKELDHVYATEFIRYETKENLAVSVDLLINGLGSRSTGASFSMEELENHCQRKKIVGTEQEVLALVPSREVLIALKIHSGRLTDFRDIAALCQKVSIPIIQQFLKRGNQELVQENIHHFLTLIEKPEFIGSFKGVFQEKRYTPDIREMQKLKQLSEHTFKKP